jgi:hypothetical protein
MACPEQRPKLLKHASEVGQAHTPAKPNPAIACSDFKTQILDGIEPIHDSDNHCPKTLCTLPYHLPNPKSPRPKQEAFESITRLEQLETFFQVTQLIVFPFL